MRARWVVVQHEPFEGPGLIAEVARARGLVVEVRRMDLAEPLPAAEEVAGLVVLGGTMSVYDDARAFPSRDAEIALLRATIARDRPVLGVCLGAQLLAAALGARVYAGPAEEIGLGRVTLTEAGRRDPVLGPCGESLPVFHCHGDTFGLPDGAVHLAVSGAYAHQAFRAGAAYAFQFHVEVDRALADAWAPPLAARGHGPVDEVRRAQAERVGRGVLDRFFSAWPSAGPVQPKSG